MLVTEDEARTSHRSDAAAWSSLPGPTTARWRFPAGRCPGVLTAGGAADDGVKTQRVLPGRRMVFAGSGPVALAFPAQLAHYGADIALVCEAGPRRRLGDVLRIARAARGNHRSAARRRTLPAALLRARVPLRYGRI